MKVIEVTNFLYNKLARIQKVEVDDELRVSKFSALIQMRWI